ncbi:MAG: insulinase family protein [Halobacteriovoraceae bacterium]|jgi:zinc protease|nr:insulinase family protein [Halobacteriovoraceae bacterium]
MKPFYSFLILIVLTVSSCGHFGSGKTGAGASNLDVDLELNVRKVTLANGLRILIMENHKLPIFSYHTFYDVGGRYESREDGTTGATHFLEHMMFKGAKKYGPGKFDSIIEGNGGSTNAYTTFDSTVYHENIPSRLVDKIIDLEADRMQHLLLDKTAFEKERGVVKEERKMRYENSPRGQLYLATMQAVFTGTPYGGSVIGDVKDLDSLDRDKMMSFFKKFYTPDNAIVVIVGDVNSSHIVDQMKEKFGSLKSSNDEIKKYKLEKNDSKNFTHKGRYNREIKIRGSNPSPMFMMAIPGEPIGTPKSFVMDILSSVLGDGESSYLNQKYVKGRRPKLSRISASNYTLKHNGVFFLSGQLLNGVSLRGFKKKLIRDSKKFCSEAITERSVQKTKNQYLVGYYGDIQSNMGIASFLGLRESFFGDYKFYKKELEIYNSVNITELKKVCNSLFQKPKNLFVSVWNRHPKGKK